MRVYRIAWSLAWGALAAASIGVAFVAWTPGGVVVTYVMTAFTTGCASMLWLSPPGNGCSGDAVRYVHAGGWGGAAAVAILALADTVGAIAWPLLALASVSSPPAVRWMLDRARAGRRSRCTRRSVRDHLPADLGRAWEQIVRGEVARLSDTELCWAWRVSYQALNERKDPGWRGHVATVREAYLTELESRHPVEIAAWLATGPLPANGPERFLRAA